MLSAPRPSWRPNYRAWFVGETAMSIGGGATSFAFPLITLGVTGSPQEAGLIALVQGAGALIGLIPGGIIADRYNRRTIRIVGGCISIGFQVALIIVIATGSATGALLAVLGFAHSLRGGVTSPSSEALLKQIVPRPLLPEKFAINSGRDAAVDIGIAPLSGLLLGVHLVLPIVLNALSSLVMVLTSFAVRPSSESHVSPRGFRLRQAVSEYTEAIKWVAHQRIRVHVLFVSTFLNFASSGSLVALTLHFASTGMPYAQIGLMTTGLSVSVLVGAALAPRLTKRLRGSTITITALSLLVIALTVVVFFPTFLVAAICLMGVGLGVAPLIASTLGFLAQVTPSGLLGRVDSISALGSSLLLPLAPAIAGFGIEWLSLSSTLAIFAAASLVCLLSCLLLRGGVRDIPALASKDA